jgi:hypothetical protein
MLVSFGSQIMLAENACNCNECECKNQDDYTAEKETCEDCFRDCLPTEGGECDCTDVCGWTKPHIVVEGKTDCPNCGTPTQYGEESSIEFDCEVHGEISWSR